MRRASKLAAVAAGLAALLALGPTHARAQAVLGPAFEHERAGRAAQAATAYLTALRSDPASVAALLGLERVLPGLGRLTELMPLIQRARTAAPDNALLRGIELRMYATLGEVDSVAAVVQRWAAAAPREEAPYREWAIVLQDRRLIDDARRALLQGREALGRPSALAIELAELEQRVGNWEASAREWGLAVGAAATHHGSAVSLLESAPEEMRARILRQLTVPGQVRAQRVAAELLVAWGEPLRGWSLLDATLEGRPPDGPMLVRRFADRAGAAGTPDGRRAQAYALERFADLAPAAMAARARAEATRAFLAAGDRAGARRMLERMSGDSTVPPESQVLAQTAFVQALIEEGQLDSAAARLAALTNRVPVEERQALQFALARARIARGDLDQAAGILAGDSSIAALAIHGWVALYRGKLKEAAGFFRAAGPYAGERRDATERTAMLALLQQIRADESPELGAALLRLARGDSSGAVAALKQVAAQLSGGGRPDVLLLAGQVAAALPDRESEAVALFDEVVRSGAGAAAPAAELAWARLLLRQGSLQDGVAQLEYLILGFPGNPVELLAWARVLARQAKTQDAIVRLEHLILTYPGSAVVPEARRELERARGAIPRT